MKRIGLLMIGVALFSLLAGCKGQEQHKENTNHMETAPGKFKIGQVWKYHNRAGEDSSTLTILKIEKYEKGGTIVHISVDGIKLYNPDAPGGYSSFIGHLPFAEAALFKSVTQLTGQNNNLPDYAEGYNDWKEAWDKGKGGYWTIDLKEAINGIDRVMRQNK